MSEDDQVVAYDAEGKPLYHHSKPKTTPKESKENTHSSKSSLVKLKHDRSVQEFPGVKLDDDEYVEVSVARHSIGIILIWTVVGALVAALLVMLFVVISGDHMLKVADQGAGGYIVMAVVAVLALAFVTGYIATTIYRGSRFLVTNKKVEQYIVRGLFDQTTQTINLVMIEDISYTQSNFFEHMLNYGKIRLSTIGDETMYEFSFVRDPDAQVKEITKVVEGVRQRTVANNLTGPGVTFNVGSS